MRQLLLAKKLQDLTIKVFDDDGAIKDFYLFG